MKSWLANIAKFAHTRPVRPRLSLTPVCVERKFDFHFAFPELSCGWIESEISPCTRKWPKFRDGTVKFQPHLTRKMANKKKFSLILSMADYESFFQVTWIWLWIFLFHLVLDIFFWIKLLLEKREKNVLIFQLFFLSSLFSPLIRTSNRAKYLFLGITRFGQRSTSTMLSWSCRRWLWVLYFVVIFLMTYIIDDSIRDIQTISYDDSVEAEKNRRILFQLSEQLLRFSELFNFLFP